MLFKAFSAILEETAASSVFPASVNSAIFWHVARCFGQSHNCLISPNSTKLENTLHKATAILWYFASFTCIILTACSSRQKHWGFQCFNGCKLMRLYQTVWGPLSDFQLLLVSTACSLKNNKMFTETTPKLRCSHLKCNFEQTCTKARNVVDVTQVAPIPCVAIISLLCV